VDSTLALRLKTPPRGFAGIIFSQGFFSLYFQSRLDPAISFVHMIVEEMWDSRALADGLESTLNVAGQSHKYHMQ
jgi:hypothetical protein